MKKQTIIITTGVVALLLVVLLSSMFSKSAKDYSNLLFVNGITNETGREIGRDNDRMYRRLELMLQDEKVVGEIYAKFLRIKKTNEELQKYISRLHGDLIGRAEGIERYVGDTLRYSLLKNDSDISEKKA